MLTGGEQEIFIDMKDYIPGLTFDMVVKVALKLDGPKMWGLHPEKGWKRPTVIDYNGEWYIMVKEDNEYFQDRYYNYNQDVADGIYVPTGVKVGEE